MFERRRRVSIVSGPYEDQYPIVDAILQLADMVGDQFFVAGHRANQVRKWDVATLCGAPPATPHESVVGPDRFCSGRQLPEEQRTLMGLSARARPLTLPMTAYSAQRRF